MFNLDRYFRSTTRSSQSKRPKNKRHRKMLAEPLERRELFAVGSYAIPNPLTPGNPAPNGMAIDGVVALEIGRGCSGSLLSTGRHVLTAQHCLPNGGFPDGNDTLTVRFDVPGQSPVRMQVDAAHMSMAGWDGAWAGGNGSDLAILELPSLAPLRATRYEIYNGGSEYLQNFSFVGYGMTGTGATGDTIPSGNQKRYGENRIEIAGDSSPWGLSPHSLVFDFDNGNPPFGQQPGNDYFSTVTPAQPNLGVGANEAMLGDGDSGGPAFLNGQIAGVASYTWFNGNAVDVDPGARRTFGEVGVFTRVSEFSAWINQTILQPYDLTIDTTVLGMGNNGALDQIIVATYGDYTQITVNGINVHTDLTSQIQRLSINGSNDVDYVRLANMPGFPITVQSQGGDDIITTYNVGLPWQLFDKSIKIDGGDGRDVLNIDDSDAAPGYALWLTDPEYLIDSRSVGRMVATNLGWQTNELAYQGIEDLQLKTGNYSGDVYVTDLGSSTIATIHGSDFDDRFWIGDNEFEGLETQGLSELSNVVVSGGLGYDELFVSDRQNPDGGQSYFVDGLGIRSGAASIGYLVPGDIESVSLSTTDQSDDLLLMSNWGDAALQIDSGDGGDVFSFANLAPTGWFDGQLKLNAGEGDDHLQVIDTRQRDPQWYTVDGGSIGRYGETFSFSTETFEIIELQGSQAGSTFAVTDTRMSTVTKLIGSNSDDYLYLYDANQTLDQVEGELFFDGRGGGDLVDMLDDLNPVGQTYYLADNALLRSGLAPIHFEAEFLVLSTGTGDDRVIVDDGRLGGAFDTTVLLYAGEGEDTLDYSLYETSVSVDLLIGVATGIASVRGIEHALGGQDADWLYGDDQANILRGNGGDDIIDGRGGRDFLIGGSGSDTIYGGGGDDLIVGGLVEYDENRNDPALLAILAEWVRTDIGYAKRAKRIRGLDNSGVNDGYVLNSGTVFDDEATDEIHGEGGKDLYFAMVGEIAGRQSGEVLVNPS